MVRLAKDIGKQSLKIGINLDQILTIQKKLSQKWKLFRVVTATESPTPFEFAPTICLLFQA
jgi:hypothetical protein